MKWVGPAILFFLALAILFDAIRYRFARCKVLRLLREHGSMTGLELSKVGISRAHVYLLLRRLEEDGKVEGYLVDDPLYGGQKKYKLAKWH